MQKEFPEAEVFEIKKVNLKSPIIFAGFVGAVAVNAIVQSFGGYLPLFIFMGCLSIGAAVLIFLVKPVKKPT